MAILLTGYQNFPAIKLPPVGAGDLVAYQVTCRMEMSGMAAKVGAGLGKGRGGRV